MSPPSTPQPWTPLTRFAFRFIFVYFMLFALCAGNATAWEALPFGFALEGLAAKPYNHLAQFTAQHLFHFTGIAAHLHPSGYGDRLLDWIAAALMLLTAALITPIWTVLDKRRTEYTTLYLYL
ncbi:MAG: hypothetical protein V4555_17955, partial [Acidobacteriota bacterium]